MGVFLIVIECLKCLWYFTGRCEGGKRGADRHRAIPLMSSFLEVMGHL